MQDATAAGETGGSIVITGLENGEVYDLSGTFNPGGDGGGGDAGTFEVSIPSDVTLEAGTTLPTTADVTIDTGATLTVNGTDSTGRWYEQTTKVLARWSSSISTAIPSRRTRMFSFNTFTFDGWLDGTDA